MAMETSHHGELRETNQSILVSAQRHYQVNASRNNLRSSLPPEFCNHIGLEAGDSLDIQLHPGGLAVPIKEPCIIIRPLCAGGQRE